MQMQVIVDRFLRSEKSRSFNLKIIDKLLCFFLASYMGEKNYCFPSYATLMADLGVNDRTTIAASLKRLKKAEIIIIQKRYHQSHVYKFNLETITVKSCPNN